MLHAGGTANMYSFWPELFGPTFRITAVNYPENVCQKKEADHWDAIIVHYFQQLSNELCPPYFLFGHSMGAMVCFELARNLYQSQFLLPEHVFISGCRAPHLGMFKHGRQSFQEMDDPKLLQQLESFQGIPLRYVRNASLVQDWLLRMRDQLMLCEKYVYKPGPKINIPLTVFGGTVDPLVDKSSLKAWRMHTNGSFQSYFFSGNHFYLSSQQSRLIQKIKGVVQYG